ncbi:MAG: DUF411 domain-containing protein [Marivibrio sp.]|uniref:DUF411 domain-containing protein n=1 Tax=Marivibrio sp. TaxID=2039719 RepID=UPI0032EEB488
MTRRRALATLAALPVLYAAGRAWPARAEAPTLYVAKSPTCGCCSAWVERMRAAGFNASVQDVSNAWLYQMKARLGVTEALASCHTARIDGYVIEGHVPAADVARLLRERPDALGLTVPGMPIGSPGMEMGDHVDAYDVLLIGRDGATDVFARYGRG